MTPDRIPYVTDTRCSLPGEAGPTCYHYSLCDNATRDCVCSVTYAPYSLCTQPVFEVPGAFRETFYAYKITTFVLQGLVLSCCLVYLAINLWRRAPALHRAHGALAKWKQVVRTEQVGLTLVAMSALFDIVYNAVDPYWGQRLISQAHEAFLFMFGDLFIAFDVAAYAILTNLWVKIRMRARLGSEWSIPAKAFMVSCITLPFVSVAIGFILRAIDLADFDGLAQIQFFAVIIFVCLFYGIIIVTFGSLTLRDLKRANQFRGRSHGHLMFRLAVQLICSGAVLLLGIIALIVFVAIPITDELAYVWLKLFAPQLVFFFTQLPVLYLFRARLARSKETLTPTHNTDGGRGSATQQGTLVVDSNHVSRVISEPPMENVDM